MIHATIIWDESTGELSIVDMASMNHVAPGGLVPQEVTQFLITIDKFNNQIRAMKNVNAIAGAAMQAATGGRAVQSGHGKPVPQTQPSAPKTPFDHAMDVVGGP